MKVTGSGRIASSHKKPRFIMEFSAPRRRRQMEELEEKENGRVIYE
jgi:hypothetical protein